MVDLLYLAKNRLAFTQASIAALLANTDWSLVRKVYVYDDGSVDGTREYLWSVRWPVAESIICESSLGSPVAIMGHYLERVGASGAEVFAKLDNDVIVPAGWLNAASETMERHPDLDLLGLEPPLSRTRSPWSQKDPVRPELVGRSHGYAPCDSIGGIGLMRRRAFAERRAMRPFSIYGGFTDWQQQHADLIRGWIVPPISLFLLDRLPVEPWAGLSNEYIRRGWQRPWTNYSPGSRELWSWWAERAA